MYAGKVTFLTALSALHGDSFHVARFVHKCGNWVNKKGGKHAQEGGAHGGPIVRKFQTKSATTKCVISSAAKHKSSTKLHTIWSHVLDRSAKVLNKLIIPCRYCTHSFTIDEFALAKYNVQLSVSYWPSGKFRRPLGRSAP